MTRHTLILTTTLFLGIAAFAQDTRIFGKVADARKRPMQGVSLAITGTYDGATTDSAGNFSFSTPEKGSVTFQASFTGFYNYEKQLDLKGDSLYLDIVLKEAPNELTAVVITAGSFEASAEKKATVLKPLDIVTTASANADVAAALRTLPGTQQVGESAELFVRGGEGYETRQFIDGMAAPNPFFSAAPNIASRGRFSPFLFKGTVFSTGGYSALYGQALSSAVILESVDLPARSEASASFSPLFAGAQYQHLANSKKLSWGASAGYTHLGAYFALVPQRPDYFKAPQIQDADINFRIKTSGQGMLKFYAKYSGNKLGLRTPDMDSSLLKNAFGLTGQNLYTNLSYRERLANRLMVKAGLSVSLNSDEMQQDVQDANNQIISTPLTGIWKDKQYRLNAHNTLVQARAVFEYKLTGLSALRWGGEYWFSKDSTSFNGYRAGITDHLGAAFAEGDIYITNRLAFRAGLRAENSSLLQRANLAPRATLAYQFSRQAQLSADYGMFYQKPVNQYLLFNPDMPFMRADHMIFTYQRQTALTTLRAQIFNKDYRQLTRMAADTTGTGTGFARGFELFWRDKKSLKGFDYWLTYSYLDTKREYLRYPYAMEPPFAARHTANLVVKRFFTKMNTQFNLNYQYATGRPYYHLVPKEPGAPWTVADAGRTIDFNSLSVSVNYLAKMGKAFGVVVVSVTNVLNSRQVFGYQYNAAGHKTEVVPPARQFFFAGIFLSWGTDRTQDAINNNL